MNTGLLGYFGITDSGGKGAMAYPCKNNLPTVRASLLTSLNMSGRGGGPCRVRSKLNKSEHVWSWGGGARPDLGPGSPCTVRSHVRGPGDPCLVRSNAQ